MSGWKRSVGSATVSGVVAMGAPGVGEVAGVAEPADDVLEVSVLIGGLKVSLLSIEESPLYYAYVRIVAQIALWGNVVVLEVWR